MVIPTLKVYRMPYPDLVKLLRGCLSEVKGVGDRLENSWAAQRGAHSLNISNTRLGNSRPPRIRTGKVMAMYQPKKLSAVDRVSPLISTDSESMKSQVASRYTPLLNVLQQATVSQKPEIHDSRSLVEAVNELLDEPPTWVLPQPGTELKANTGRLWDEVQGRQIARVSTVEEKEVHEPSAISTVWDDILRDAPQPIGDEHTGGDPSVELRQVDWRVSKLFF